MPLKFIERIFCLCRSSRSEAPVQVAECVLDFGPESTGTTYGSRQQQRRLWNRPTRIVVRRTSTSAFVDLSDIDEEDEEADSNDGCDDYVDDVNVAKFLTAAVDNDVHDDSSSTFSGKLATHYSMVENARRAVAALAVTTVDTDADAPRRDSLMTRRIAILRNGSAMPIRYGYMKDVRIEVQNTCAFDTLVQMFACATVDSEPFGNRMLRGVEPPGLFVQLIQSLLKIGATSATYNLRVQILYSAFPHDPAFKSSADTFARISCDCHVKAMADKVLTSDLPTGLERRYCSDPACPRPSKTVPVASVPYSSCTGGFDDKFPETIDGLTKPVRSPCVHDSCQGEWTIEIALADHMLVEVQNIPSESLFEWASSDRIEAGNLLDDAGAVYGDVSCTLDSIPATVMVKGAQYVLRAAAVFIGDRKPASASSIGHYVAMAHRNDGRWLEYDDFATGSAPQTSGTDKRDVQFVLYTKES